MIPKIIHFIYPVTDKTRPWSIVNSLAVDLALKVHKNHQIWIWSNNPSQVPYFEGAITRFCDLPTQIGGKEIVWPQYVSDVMRLQILLEHGGIYMDTDILSLKPLDEFMHHPLVLSWETSHYESISNALMMAKPDNLFLQAWLDKMPEAMESRTWAYGGVVLPRKLALNPYLLQDRTILENSFCCPLDLSQNWLFDPAMKEQAKEKSKNSYAIHVFETYWRDVVKRITPEWCKKNDCFFSEIWSQN